jgi:hypothetical protein
MVRGFEQCFVHKDVIGSYAWVRECGRTMNSATTLMTSRKDAIGFHACSWR